MIIRTSLLAGAILSILLIFGTTSCKKCKLSDGDQNSGIIENVIIYPKSGYISSSHNGKLHITASNAYANEFEVSFDGGATRVPVDYAQYSILANGINVPCEASINKSVTYDANLDVYTYSITGETCSGCNTERYIENYVLVNAIPDGAQIIFDQNVSQK